MTSETPELVWTKVLDADELPEGRVKPVTCQHRTLCMIRHEGRFGALGISVRGKEELDEALQKAIAHEGPSLVEIHSDVELI